MIEDALSRQVIGCAMQVHRALGTGFLESVYHRALELELADAGIDFVSELKLDVFYKNRIVGHFIADLIIENRLIVELKAIETLSAIHEVQLVNYLTATNKDAGLLINFGSKSLQFKRKHRRR